MVKALVFISDMRGGGFAADSDPPIVSAHGDNPLAEEIAGGAEDRAFIDGLESSDTEQRNWSIAELLSDGFSQTQTHDFTCHSPTASEYTLDDFDLDRALSALGLTHGEHAQNREIVDAEIKRANDVIQAHAERRIARKLVKQERRRRSSH